MDFEAKLKVKRFTETAKLPTRANQADAGFDLYYDGPQKTAIAGTVNDLELGVGVEIPKGMVGLVFPRSGLSRKHGTAVLANVVDPEYTGAIHAVVVPAEDFEVAAGDRIAQLVIVPCWTPKVEEVTDFKATERGSSGFGSSGK